MPATSTQSPAAALTLKALQVDFRAQANPERARTFKRFFRSGPGEYGEGDVFLGLTVPQTRLAARQCKGASLTVMTGLLASKYHEERLLGLLLMVEAFRKGKGRPDVRKAVFEAYLEHKGRVNNWDLVDTSAPGIVGAWLLDEGGLKSHPKLLDTLAASKVLWDRRIAVLATFHFIRQGRFDWTLKLAEKLLDDKEDLIHKAVGWMLREIGERDLAAEAAFLDRQAERMPRTMLRYAIEKFPESRRKAYLARKPERRA